MKISVLRIGERLVRDDRVTTHAALVARAFGAARIYMSDIGGSIPRTLDAVREAWGGDFEVVPTPSWRRVLAGAPARGERVVHLTMYGVPVGEAAPRIAGEESILVVIGAGKVPREVYDAADYNVAVGAQPHSEVAALAVLLDRVQQGRELDAGFAGARRRVVPSARGKRVVGA